MKELTKEIAEIDKLIEKQYNSEKNSIMLFLKE